MQLVKRIRRYFVASIFLSICYLPILASAEMAPNFNIKTGNTSISLSSLKNRVVYVDFWASWCTPCLKSFPWMNEMQERYENQGLSIIAINLDQDRELAQKFLAKVPAKFKIAYDPQGKIAEAYKVSAMPSAFIIDPAGNIVLKKLGFKIQEKEEMERKINELLAYYKVGKR